MVKYILVYSLNGFADDGGGTYASDFPTEQQLHSEVNKLANEHKERFSVNYAGLLQIEFKYNPVSIVTEYQPERV